VEPETHGVPVRVNRPFVGIPSFLRSPICTDLEALDATIAVMGVPTDEGSPFLPGARFGPRGIREHSLRFGAGGKGVFDSRTGQRLLEYEMTNRRLVDVGDADVVPTNVAGTFEKITRMTRQLVERGMLPVVLGGDHAITFPVVRGFSGPLHVFHFDAHTDYAPFTDGLEMTNGHAFRHIRRMTHVETLTQVGIRGLRTSMQDSIADGNRVVTMYEFQGLSPAALVEPLPRDARCFVSIDIDALDMSLVPGTVSAEPDGMSYGQLRDGLVALAQRAEIVGFDLVEVNPLLDVGTGVTSYLAAHIIIEFLGHICDQPRWRERRS
jgi:agmatinase